MDFFDFRGKKVFVTGASSGLGREVAVCMSDAGAKVFFVARRENELKKTLSRMKGKGHHYQVCDISDFNAVIQIFQTFVEHDGQKFDFIAHCAGIGVPMALRSISVDMLDSMFRTNFYSFAALLRCAAKKRLFNNGGSVVGVSSYAALYGHAGNSIYAASKGAMDALMRSAAKELRPRKIRVNTICPQGIRTEMLVNQIYTTINANSVESLPEDLMKPEKLALVVLALLSDAMQYVSGAALEIDEGKGRIY